MKKIINTLVLTVAMLPITLKAFPDILSHEIDELNLNSNEKSADLINTAISEINEFDLETNALESVILKLVQNQLKTAINNCKKKVSEEKKKQLEDFGSLFEVDTGSNPGIVLKIFENFKANENYLQEADEMDNFFKSIDKAVYPSCLPFFNYYLYLIKKTYQYRIRIEKIDKKRLEFIRNKISVNNELIESHRLPSDDEKTIRNFDESNEAFKKFSTFLEKVLNHYNALYDKWKALKSTRKKMVKHLYTLDRDFDTLMVVHNYLKVREQIESKYPDSLAVVYQILLKIEIEIEVDEGEKGEYQCSGSLMNDLNNIDTTPARIKNFSKFMTAAHCFEYYKNHLNPKKITYTLYNVDPKSKEEKKLLTKEITVDEIEVKIKLWLDSQNRENDFVYFDLPTDITVTSDKEFTFQNYIPNEEITKILKEKNPLVLSAGFFYTSDKIKKFNQDSIYDLGEFSDGVDHPILVRPMDKMELHNYFEDDLKINLNQNIDVSNSVFAFGGSLKGGMSGGPLMILNGMEITIIGVNSAGAVSTSYFTRPFFQRFVI